MKLLRVLQRLILSWFGADRIRLSPTEGSWLRLHADDVVLIREMLFTVMDRNTMITPKVSRLDFQLRRSDETSEESVLLRVELVGEALDFVSASLTMDGDVIELFEDDPVVISCSTMAENA